jgi:hypothetical protein
MVIADMVIFKCYTPRQTKIVQLCGTMGTVNNLMRPLLPSTKYVVCP